MATHKTMLYLPRASCDQGLPQTSSTALRLTWFSHVSFLAGFCGREQQLAKINLSLQYIAILGRSKIVIF